MFLVIDFYNVFKKVSYHNYGVVVPFFSYINNLCAKLKTDKVVLCMDGHHYFKKRIEKTYKEHRKLSNVDSESVEEIKKIALTLPNWCVIIEDSMEADDLAYSFCEDNPNCICVSEDYDWLYNLSLKNNISVYRDNNLITRENFEYLFKYPVDKIGLDLFLRGDSKDSVTKPFRLKGNLLHNILTYKDIPDYIITNELSLDKLKTYIRLIFPIVNKKYLRHDGFITENTSKYISKYNLDFFRHYLVEEGTIL